MQGFRYSPHLPQSAMPFRKSKQWSSSHILCVPSLLGAGFTCSAGDFNSNPEMGCDVVETVSSCVIYQPGRVIFRCSECCHQHNLIQGAPNDETLQDARFPIRTFLNVLGQSISGFLIPEKCKGQRNEEWWNQFADSKGNFNEAIPIKYIDISIQCI